MFLGVLEAVMHTAMIPLLKLGRPYSPGLVTAMLVLLPISLYAMIHAVGQDPVRPLDWLWALVYMAVGLIPGAEIRRESKRHVLPPVPTQRSSRNFCALRR